MIQLAAQERSRRTQWLRLFVPVSQVAEVISEMTQLAPLERIRNAHCRKSLVSVRQAAHEIRSHISEWHWNSADVWKPLLFRAAHVPTWETSMADTSRCWLSRPWGAPSSVDGVVFFNGHVYRDMAKSGAVAGSAWIRHVGR